MNSDEYCYLFLYSPTNKRQSMHSKSPSSHRQKKARQQVQIQNNDDCFIQHQMDCSHGLWVPDKLLTRSSLQGASDNSL